MRDFFKFAGIYWLIYISMMIMSYNYMKYVKGLEHPGETNTTVFAITAMLVTIAIDIWHTKWKTEEEEE